MVTTRVEAKSIPLWLNTIGLHYHYTDDDGEEQTVFVEFVEPEEED